MNLGQWMTLLEKKHYLFRHWPHNYSDAVLFPGCSFPSQFPKTMQTLELLCAEHGVSVAYDCCGKPLAELHRAKDAARIVSELFTRLDDLGAQKVIALCPNCRQYLEAVLDRPVVSIYTVLEQWGFRQDTIQEGFVFCPCPDRTDETLLKQIERLIPLSQLERIEQVPCCGLRGDIMSHGPQAGDRLCTLVEEQQAGRPLYTYCASCSGQFARHGCGKVRHLLSVILGIEESPDIAHAIQNRASKRFPLFRTNYMLCKGEKR